MSYAVFNSIYGIPLDTDEIMISSELAILIEDEEPGFITMYSGSGSTPQAFGVNLEQSFDECSHHIEMSEILTTVTPEQIQEYQELFDAQDDNIKAELLDIGEPRLFLLVSSS